MSPVDGNNSELFNQLHRLTGLHTVDMRASNFEGAAFHSLEKLTNVKKANLSNVKIDSKQLARSKFLRVMLLKTNNWPPSPISTYLPISI